MSRNLREYARTASARVREDVRFMFALEGEQYVNDAKDIICKYYDDADEAKACMDVIIYAPGWRYDDPPMMTIKELDCACYVWKHYHDADAAVYVGHILTDMLRNGRRHAEEIYEVFIASHKHDIMTMISPELYDDIRIVPVHDTVFEANYLRFNSMNRYHHDGLLYSTLYNLFGDRADAYIASIGISHVITMFSLSLYADIKARYGLTPKKTWQIAYELSLHDKSSLSWFIDFLSSVNASGARRITVGCKIDTEWVLQHAQYPIEFLMESPVSDGVDMEEYKHATIMTMKHINDAIKPASSEHECSADDFCDYEDHYSKQLIPFSYHSDLAYSMMTMLGASSANDKGVRQYEDFTEYKLRRMMVLMQSLSGIPDMVFNAMYGSHELWNDDRKAYVYNARDGFSNYCGHSYHESCSYGFSVCGFDTITYCHDSDNDNSTMNTAKRIERLHSDDAWYRWAIWTNVCAALKYRERDILHACGYQDHAYSVFIGYLRERPWLDKHTKHVPEEAWEYICHGVIPDSITYDYGVTLRHDVIASLLDNLGRIPTTLRGMMDITDNEHVSEVIDDILDIKHTKDEPTDIYLRHHQGAISIRS